MNIKLILMRLLIFTLFLSTFTYAQDNRNNNLDRLIESLENQVPQIYTLERKSDWLIINCFNVDDIMESKMVRISEMQEIAMGKYGSNYVIYIYLANRINALTFKLPEGDSPKLTGAEAKKYYNNMCKIIYTDK